MKRAIATITVYVYGDTEQEMYDQANKLAHEIKGEIYCNPKVEKLHNAPFGSYGEEITEIDLNKLQIRYDK